MASVEENKLYLACPVIRLARFCRIGLPWIMIGTPI